MIDCLFAFLAIAWAAAGAAEPCPTAAASSGGCGVACQVYRSGSWIVEETTNFHICRPAGGRPQPGVGQKFEALRLELCQSWSVRTGVESWQPKCHIVLHSTVASYVNEVGPGSQNTVGSALVDFGAGRVTSRRIDLRGDRPDWFVAAVPHELTHIVLADRFGHARIPHWADEGAALLADTADKRRRHARDLSAALESGGAFRVVELLALNEYPRSSRMGAFYGQSASLVSFLVAQGATEQFVAFVNQANEQGYDAALREVYSIEGVPDLERRWRRSLAAGQGTIAVLKPRSSTAEAALLAESKQAAAGPESTVVAEAGPLAE